jgi:ferredoxin, 2Fe-2S
VVDYENHGDFVLRKLWAKVFFPDRKSASERRLGISIHQADVPPLEVPVESDSRESVLELVLAQSIEISHSCGGMGTCGTCRIEVMSQPEGLQPRNDIEREMALERGFEEQERLACQTPARPGMKIRIP